MAPFNPSKVQVISPNDTEKDDFFYVTETSGKSSVNRKLKELHEKYGFNEKELVVTKQKKKDRFGKPYYRIFSSYSVPVERY